MASPTNSPLPHDSWFVRQKFNQTIVSARIDVSAHCKTHGRGTGRHSDSLFHVRTLFIPLLCFSALAQTPSVTKADFEKHPALTIANDKLELTVTVLGASFAKLLLRDNKDAPNPFWEPVRMARELGQNSEFRGGTGHFVCVDGFGPTSREERTAGLPGHGEAHLQQYSETHSADEKLVTLTMTAELPIVREKFTRTIRLAKGENLIYVSSQLENLLGFDRPVNWAEHATVGSPFLESGNTVIDVSGSRSMTRPYDQVKTGNSDRRLAPGKEFTWPMAPGLEGKTIDLRQTPSDPHYLDHATTVVDAQRSYGWVTALNTRTHLIVGYLFRREDFPWVQYWGNYPPTMKMSRGLEFSTQPFDVPRRETVDTRTLLDTPMYRWLPAKSSISTGFVLFYAAVPEGMVRVDDVRLENGQLVIEDRSSAKRVTLAASQASRLNRQ